MRKENRPEITIKDSKEQKRQEQSDLDQIAT